MKYALHLIHVVVLFAITIGSSRAQEANSFHLDEDNGLPSDHVYGMITDRHGYLWICTDKGVVKYNGYECKVFTTSDGLPKEDVWELVEDKMGKIWLGSISHDMGYIYNDKYHPAYIKGSDKTIYPRAIRRTEKGILFLSWYHSKNTLPTIFFSEGDTLHTYVVEESNFKDTMEVANAINDELGVPYFICHKNIYTVTSSDRNGGLSGKSKLQTRVVATVDSFPDDFSTKTHFVIGDYVMSYINDKNFIYLTHIKTGHIRKEFVDLEKGETIQYIYFEKKSKKYNSFYILTKDDILKCRLDSTIHIMARYHINDFVGDSVVQGNELTTVLADSFWNYCIGSNSRGIWINSKKPFDFHTTGINMPAYTCVGTYKDSLSFWYDKVQRKLAVADSRLNITYRAADIERDINAITHYSGDTFVVSSLFPKFYLLKTGRFTSTYLSAATVLNTYVKNRDDVYFVSIFGFTEQKIKDGVATRIVHDLDRYTGLAFDSFRNCIWAYNDAKICVNHENNNAILDKKFLHKVGVHELHGITIDSRYGNVFLNGRDKVVMYNYEKNEHTELFPGVRLKDDMSVFVADSKLIITWRGGVLISYVNGPMSLSKPLSFFNEKHFKYKKLYGSCVSGGKILLNTDRGFFTVNIPSREVLMNSEATESSRYKFILTYNGRTRRVDNRDTVMAYQEDRVMLLDVIRPAGTGKLKYFYSFKRDASFLELNSNEINIPLSFPVDDYSKIFIYASDDSWKSDTLELNIYIVPHRWQTHLARKVIFVGSGLLALLAIMAIILLTRRLVLKSSERKQLQMELELKAIYSQINPHFIFNSLNSALLLVSKNKMDEAYTHISKFSKLLRSYLKSSRNKYVTVAEEVENLKNYIELQQTRFKSRFLYDIDVDPELVNRATKIPSLLIQPFVENAINHGILPKMEEGRLSVKFVLNNFENKIICTIDDNGIGREQSRRLMEGAEEIKDSYGDLMIKDLVSIFNKYERMNIDISYNDKSAPDTGTIVTITIKNPHYEK